MENRNNPDLSTKELFDFKKYVNKPLWNSYYHQIFETLECSDENIISCLIIGKGDGMVPFILKQLGIKIFTFDFSSHLNPDFCGDVSEISKVLPEGFKVDVIICCEVLEHLPYEEFEPILKQFITIATKRVVLSLPVYAMNIIINFKLPKILLIKKIFLFSKFYEKKSKIYENHYWEIKAKNYSQKRITQSIQQSGFKIIKKYNVFENPYHYFFVLEADKTPPPR